MKKKSCGYLMSKYMDHSICIVCCDAPHTGIPSVDAVLDQFEETAKTTRIPEWDIKYAALYFTFDEQVYRISPSRFNQCDAAFELLVNDLIDALWNVGAYDMFYSGMMD